jgi:hypothetical protein
MVLLHLPSVVSCRLNLMVFLKKTACSLIARMKPETVWLHRLQRYTPEKSTHEDTRKSARHGQQTVHLQLLLHLNYSRSMLFFLLVQLTTMN